MATTRKLDLAHLIEEDGTKGLFTVLEWNEASSPGRDTGSRWAVVIRGAN